MAEGRGVIGALARAVLTAGLVLGLSACGSRVAPAPVPLAADMADPAPARQAPASSAAPDATAPADLDQPPADPTPSASPTGRDIAREEAEFAEIEKDNRDFRITVLHACRRHGEVQQVEVYTAPSSNISLIVGYQDSQPHGAMFVGTSDAAGRYTWRFPVSPSAPVGDAVVLASGPGHHETGEGGGSTHGRFRVPGPEGC